MAIFLKQDYSFSVKDTFFSTADSHSYGSRNRIV